MGCTHCSRRFIRKSDVKRSGCAGSFDGEDDQAEEGAEGDGGEVFRGLRRKDEDEAFAFNEGGKTGDAKGHEEQAEDGPAIEFGFGGAGGGAQVKSNSDDGAEAERGEPETRAGIEIANEHDEIPGKVTPEDEAASIEISQIAQKHGRD